jgi:hypothetical protein
MKMICHSAAKLHFQLFSRLVRSYSHSHSNLQMIQMIQIIWHTFWQQYKTFIVQAIGPRQLSLNEEISEIWMIEKYLTWSYRNNGFTLNSLSQTIPFWIFESIFDHVTPKKVSKRSSLIKPSTFNFVPSKNRFSKARESLFKHSLILLRQADSPSKNANIFPFIPFPPPTPSIPTKRFKSVRKGTWITILRVYRTGKKKKKKKKNRIPTKRSIPVKKKRPTVKTAQIPGHPRFAIGRLLNQLLFCRVSTNFASRFDTKFSFHISRGGINGDDSNVNGSLHYWGTFLRPWTIAHPLTFSMHVWPVRRKSRKQTQSIFHYLDREHGSD